MKFFLKTCLLVFYLGILILIGYLESPLIQKLINLIFENNHSLIYSLSIPLIVTIVSFSDTKKSIVGLVGTALVILLVTSYGLNIKQSIRDTEIEYLESIRIENQRSIEEIPKEKKCNWYEIDGKWVQSKKCLKYNEEILNLHLIKYSEIKKNKPAIDYYIPIIKTIFALTVSVILVLSTIVISKNCKDLFNTIKFELNNKEIIRPQIINPREQVLIEFNKNPDITLREVAAITNIPLSTVYRLKQKLSGETKLKRSEKW